MSRIRWSLYAYQMIEPDEQLDLFACREVRLHLSHRQLKLGSPADRTLCNGLLPARPRWQSLAREALKDARLCEHCLARLQAERQGVASVGNF